MLYHKSGTFQMTSHTQVYQKSRLACANGTCLSRTASTNWISLAMLELIWMCVTVTVWRELLHPDTYNVNSGQECPRANSLSLSLREKDRSWLSITIISSTNERTAIIGLTNEGLHANFFCVLSFDGGRRGYMGPAIGPHLTSRSKDVIWYNV